MKQNRDTPKSRVPLRHVLNLPQFQNSLDHPRNDRALFPFQPLNSILSLSQSLGPQQIQRERGTLVTHLSNYINPQSAQAKRALEAHFEKERRIRAEDSYKTVMCQNWLLTASCPFGNNCRFAHGEHELRESMISLVPSGKYKTKLCSKYQRGVCPFGVKCLFIHPGEVASESQQGHNQSGIPAVPVVRNPSSYFPMPNLYGLTSDSPPELLSQQNNFSSSLPINANIKAHMAGLKINDGAGYDENRPPIMPPKSKNLLPQLQRQLCVEDKKNDTRDLLKKMDKEKKTQRVTFADQTSSQKNDPFTDNFETYVSTISSVLDTSDL